jgi:hypothetical protein
MKQFVAFSAWVAFVAGHGFVQNATIGGKEYDVLLALQNILAKRQMLTKRPISSTMYLALRRNRICAD